jgi:hypothetical protein
LRRRQGRLSHQLNLPGPDVEGGSKVFQPPGNSKEWKAHRGAGEPNDRPPTKDFTLVLKHQDDWGIQEGKGLPAAHATSIALDRSRQVDTDPVGKIDWKNNIVRAGVYQDVTPILAPRADNLDGDKGLYSGSTTPERRDG